MLLDGRDNRVERDGHLKFRRAFLKVATITLMAVNWYVWILTFPGIEKASDWKGSMMVPYRMGCLLDTICLLLSLIIVLFRRGVPVLIGVGVGWSVLALLVRLGFFYDGFQPGYWFEPWFRGGSYILMFWLIHLTWRLRWKRGA